MINVKKNFPNKKVSIAYKKIIEGLQSVFCKLFHNDKQYAVIRLKNRFYVACFSGTRLILSSIFAYHLHKRSSIARRNYNGSYLWDFVQNPDVKALFEEINHYAKIDSYRVNHFIIDFDDIIKAFMFDAAKNEDVIAIMLDYIQENEEEYAGVLSSEDWPELRQFPKWNNLAKLFIK